MKEYEAAHDEMLEAERALAAARGESHAVPLAFPVRWDTGAPLPHLVQNDYRTFLLFLLPDADPEWDGTSVTVMDAGVPASLAIVEFRGCIATKMGSPNDEVYEGHPLHGRGFIGYRALQVIHSPWIREIEQINAVHAQYKPEAWKKFSHFVLGFHDCTFECVARSFSVETSTQSIREALRAICERL